jgi:hypothetical protein
MRPICEAARRSARLLDCGAQAVAGACKEPFRFGQRNPNR